MLVFCIDIDQSLAYRNPKRKTNNSAILVLFGMLRSTKIHKGKPRTRRSVIMFHVAVIVNTILWSTQRPPGMVLSQLKDIGVHWKTMTKKNAIICAMLRVLRAMMNRRTPVFWPKSRSRKRSTDDLTSAKIGLYSICTA